MHAALNRLLLLLALGVTLLDAAWLALGHFAIDARNYAILFALALLLAGLAAYYGRRRGEADLAALLANAAFLILFPAGACLASYLLVTIAGPRIDMELARLDQAMGFHWPALMALAADHPRINAALALAYTSVMPQSVLLLFALGLTRRSAALYAMSLALAFGAILTLALWTAAPSFGAFSVFTLPDPVARKLGLVLGFDYARDLVQMLKTGPGFISPTQLRGLVGFPSYHTLQALVLMRYGWSLPRLRWPLIALNIAVLVSTPIQGGHHLIDMLGGAGVALLAIGLAEQTVRRAARAANPAPAPQNAALAPAR